MVAGTLPIASRETSIQSTVRAAAWTIVPVALVEAANSRSVRGLGRRLHGQGALDLPLDAQFELAQIGFKVEGVKVMAGCVATLS